MPNPLLNSKQFPAFSNIKVEYIEEAVHEILEENRQKLSELLKQSVFSWENLLLPLEDMKDRLQKMWSPIEHMNNVMQTESLRNVTNTCNLLIAEYETALLQNVELFHAVKQVADHINFQNLTPAQKKVINNMLRDFKLGGVDLPDEKKKRYAELKQLLEKEKSTFKSNALEATDAWSMHITDKNELLGLPETDLANAAETAKKQNKAGWVLTLKQPVYIACQKFLSNRQLREKIYHAYQQIASDQGDFAGRWDNGPIIENIVKIRHEMANLLGYKSYAEYSLATKMAENPQRVFGFLQDLAQKALPFAKQEFADIAALAKQDGIDEVSAWDVSYYSEKLRIKKYDFSAEELRPYFPLEKVLEGYFNLLNKLYGITVCKGRPLDTWHQDVMYYEIYDENKEFLGGVYTDLFARPQKRSGAWMEACRIRRRLPDDSMQFPIAYLSANFAPPTVDKPCLLTEANVVTLFHEFGHCLHHVLTKIEHLDISGIQGVPWDGVEFPSKFMEYFCFDKAVIKSISSHYQTGEPMPEALYQKKLAAKDFLSGMQTVRQLEYGLFDLRLYAEYDPDKGARVQEILKAAKSTVAVYSTPITDRFANTFNHIFPGEYAVGYYSYKWSEVIAADAFSAFEEAGTISPEVGKRFRQAILEQGGLPHPMEAFRQFRGREPQLHALLKHSGLLAKPKVSTSSMFRPVIEEPDMPQEKNNTTLTR